jgi:hypothetical protein
MPSSRIELETSCLQDKRSTTELQGLTTIYSHICLNVFILLFLYNTRAKHGQGHGRGQGHGEINTYVNSGFIYI